MNNINKIFILTLLILSIALPAFAETKWMWICSDDDYSQFYAPDTIEKDFVNKTITIWTKTTYSYEGAKEVIKSYHKEHLVKDPSAVSFSMAQIKLNPQARKVLYLKELFYDTNGNLLWEDGVDSKWTEVSPLSYNEEIFYGIMDYIYQRQDSKMIKESDRWINLGRLDENDSTYDMYIDKISINSFGDHATAWFRWIKRDSDNHLLQVVKYKVQYNFLNKSVAILYISGWDKGKIWREESIEEAPESIIPDSRGDKEYNAVRDFIKNNYEFVNRYSVLKK